MIWSSAIRFVHNSHLENLSHVRVFEMKHGRPYHLFRPSDLLKHRRRFFEEVTRDLDPSKREAAMAILESWREGESDKDLVEVLGEELAKKLLRKEKT